ncbi:transposase [Streptomyces sp. NPDC006879]|uniref:transposase n=1 Tax=Streptomyces sp. NPDC006879 TaxID=3364767 RepID=UPI00369A196D
MRTKTNETAHFRPLLEPLDLDRSLVTFDALHSVQANVTWLVETKNAHYIAMIKRNQPTAHRQLAALPWPDIAVQHTASSAGHCRRESRSIKTCGIADELGAANRPVGARAARAARPSMPSPVSTPTRPPRPSSPPSAAAGPSRPCTMCET